MAEEGRGNVVRDVGNEFVGLCWECGFERIAFFEFKVGGGAESLLEDGVQGGVEFYGADAAGRADELLREHA